MHMMMGRGTRRWIAMIGAMLVVAGLLTGCSPSTDEVNDALADLPGVVSAVPSCHDFSCTVEIEAQPTASAAELADMLAAARTVDDAAMVEVSIARDQPGTVSAQLRIDGPPASEDLAVGTLLAWAAAEPDLAGFTVERGSADDARLSGSVVDGASIWPLAREVWPMASDLPGAELGLTRAEHLRQQSLRVEGSFPDGPVAVAEELAAGQHTAATGVLVEPGRLMVGAISRDAAASLRPLLADDPRLDGVTTEVVVTNNLLVTANTAEPGTSQRLEPILAALDDQPEVLFVTIAGRSVEADVDGVHAFPRLVERVRRRAGDAFVDTTLVLSDGPTGHRAEITPDGDDAVLDLMLALLPTPGLRTISVAQEEEPDADTAAVSFEVDVRQPGPGTGAAPEVGPEVTRLARLLSTTPGSAASYALSVTVEDAEGRSAGAAWRVDRTTGGLEISEIRGTAERQAEVRAAWALGVG